MPGMCPELNMCTSPACPAPLKGSHVGKTLACLCNSYLEAWEGKDLHIETIPGNREDLWHQMFEGGWHVKGLGHQSPPETHRHLACAGLTAWDIPEGLVFTSPGGLMYFLILEGLLWAGSLT